MRQSIPSIGCAMMGSHIQDHSPLCQNVSKLTVCKRCKTHRKVYRVQMLCRSAWDSCQTVGVLHNGYMISVRWCRASKSMSQSGTRELTMRALFLDDMFKDPIECFAQQLTGPHFYEDEFAGVHCQCGISGLCRESARVDISADVQKSHLEGWDSM